MITHIFEKQTKKRFKLRFYYHLPVVEKCLKKFLYSISSYRKLAFEPTTNEFHSDALTDSAVRPWIQLALRANILQVLQFHVFFSVRFHFGYCLCQLPHLLKFCTGNYIRIADIYIYIYIYIYRQYWQVSKYTAMLREFSFPKKGKK